MNKGFTLVELLAVLIILTALFLLTSTLVGPVLDNSKESLSEVQIKKIEESAKAYYLKEGLTGEQYVLDETKTCVNVSDLIDNGYIDKDEIIEPESGEKITGSIKIIYRANNYSYEYQDKTCSKKDMGIICEAVKETTVGTVPEGKFIPGDKYECEVKLGTTYNFYVLSTEDDKVNLIMDRNICENGNGTIESDKCLVQWINENDYMISGGTSWEAALDNNSYGPVTSMNYLYKATKDWINLPNIIMDYKDEGNHYSGIKTEHNTTKIIDSNESTVTTFLDLKARFPKKIELNNLGCEDKSDEPSDTPCDEWIVDNLSIQNGYWTLSTHLDSNDVVHDGYYLGIVGVSHVYSNVSGVRPVISLYKFQLG